MTRNDHHNSLIGDGRDTGVVTPRHVASSSVGFFVSIVIEISVAISMMGCAPTVAVPPYFTTAVDRHNAALEAIAEEERRQSRALEQFIRIVNEMRSDPPSTPNPH